MSDDNTSDNVDKSDNVDNKQKIEEPKETNAEEREEHIKEHHEKEHQEHHQPREEHHEAKRKEKKKPVAKKESELDAEFEIKLPSFFRRKKKGKKQGKEEKSEVKEEKDKDDDVKVEFDAKKIISVIKKPWFITILLLIIPLFFAISLRVYGQDLPITDVWAENTVVNYYKSGIAQQINQQYPNLPEANKQTLIEQQYAAFYEKNKAAIQMQIKSQSEFFKTTYRYADANGKNDTYTYMPDIDPYFYLRSARNYLEHGYIGDEIVNGKMWDNHMLYPLGAPRNNELHPFFLAFMYKVMNIFNSGITLMQAATYFPMIIIALAVLPAFFLGKRLAGNVGGLFSGMVVATSMAILSRTTWGHADTDAYNIFFPLLAMWLFYEMFQARKLWKQIIITLLLAATIAVYSFTWQGWWYLFDLILVTFAATILYNLYLYRKEIKGLKIIKNHDFTWPLFLSVVFFAATGLLSTLIVGFRNFSVFIREPFNFMTIKSATLDTLWPNVLTTVAELNPGTFSGIVTQLGGTLFFILGICGFVIIALKRDKNNHLDLKYSILLILWFLATIYASLKGVRFVLLIAPAFAIGFGTALGTIYNYITRISEKHLSIKKFITAPILIILFGLLFISPVKQGYALAKNDIPMINDAWYESLTAIKDNSSSNAVINSWWDFGHHFKYIADRAVTFDGASQGEPQAHWIGLALMTDNENLSIGILRMLDCKANTAFNELNKIKNDTSVSVNILYKVIVEDKENAKKILEANNLNSEQADNILQYTHCEPPEDFFITSQDMIGKSGVWAHFGSWDFNRADLWTNLRKLPKDKAIAEMLKPEAGYNYTREEAEKLYYEMQTIPDEAAANTWIAPWPSYMSNIEPCGILPNNNGTMVCNNGVVINLTTNDVMLSTREGMKHPKVIVYNERDKIGVRYYNTSDTIDIGVSIIGNSTSGYQSILSAPVIATSVFNKLFFFDGKGMQHFDKFIERRDITGFKIQVWKVNWQGRGKTNPEAVMRLNESIS